MCHRGCWKTQSANCRIFVEDQQRLEKVPCPLPMPPINEKTTTTKILLLSGQNILVDDEWIWECFHRHLLISRKSTQVLTSLQSSHHFLHSSCHRRTSAARSSCDAVARKCQVNFLNATVCLSTGSQSAWHEHATFSVFSMCLWDSEEIVPGYSTKKNNKATAAGQHL